MGDTPLLAAATVTPPPTPSYRWIVLLAMSVALYGSYYAFDYIGPLAPLLSRQLHFSDSQIGLLQAVYSLPNIVAMLVCGVLIDRIGTKKSMAMFSVLVFAGLAITAVSPRIGIMVAGRLLVGSGAEALALASNVGVARWFWHDDLSLAFGIRSTFLRLGSLTAQISPTWAPGAYTYWQWPMLIAVGFGGFCLIGAALYWMLDARGERRFALGHTAGEHRVTAGDVFRFNRSFWLISALCITFYGCIFPFETFGQKFLIEARHVSPRTASLLVGMEPFFSMIGAPIFGYLVDRYARRSLFMMFGSMLIVPVYLMLGYTDISPVDPDGDDGRRLCAGAIRDVAGARLRRREIAARAWPTVCWTRFSRSGSSRSTFSSAGSNDHWLASATNAAGLSREHVDVHRRSPCSR